MKFDLHVVSADIFSYCLKHKIDLTIEWIPRGLNTSADFISKIQDCDDWQITKEFFDHIDSLWGPHTVDCFASFYNAKLKRFFSRFWNPGCQGVYAFFQSWEGENCLIVPPVHLVPRVLSYMNTQSTIGTLIVPYWTSAVFWPLLWQRYLPNIRDCKIVKGNVHCIHGRNTKSMLGSSQWNGYLLLVRLSF
jgi:hypothetical protein